MKILYFHYKYSKSGLIHSFFGELKSEIVLKKFNISVKQKKYTHIYLLLYNIDSNRYIKKFKIQNIV